MLRQITEGVSVHTSDFLQSNAVVVHGGAGVLLIDVGVRGDEIASVADDLRKAGTSVAVGFSTHPHWDHLLWHVDLGSAPRYGTARCAGLIQARLADPGWQAAVTGMMPADLVGQVPLDDLFGRIEGLPAEATRVPWEGPEVRILEHTGHAAGHAALLVEEHGVLVAGDMLSDLLIPILNFMAPDPIGDYLAGLDLLEGVAGDVELVVPGHGSVGGAGALQARIDLDRAYLVALREGGVVDDPRLDPSAEVGTEMAALHDRQVAVVRG